MQTLKATVVIVDPDSAFRTSLAAAIYGTGCNYETLESAGMLLARPRLTVPSCLVLDIGLADFDGIDVVRRLAAERNETPIIAIANQGDIPLIVRAMKAGAAEFFLKPLTPDALLPAIRYAHAHSRAILDQMTVVRELGNRYDSLSAREREVMSRVVAGNLNKWIGAALGISEITVKAHRGKVMRKMRADSLAGLVAMALRLDLPAAPIARLATVNLVESMYGMASLTPIQAPLGGTLIAAR